MKIYILTTTDDASIGVYDSDQKVQALADLKDLAKAGDCANLRVAVRLDNGHWVTDLVADTDGNKVRRQSSELE